MDCEAVYVVKTNRFSIQALRRQKPSDDQKNRDGPCATVREKTKKLRHLRVPYFREGPIGSQVVSDNHLRGQAFQEANQRR